MGWEAAGMGSILRHNARRATSSRTATLQQASGPTFA
jgi:hypothetical protein